MKHTRIFATLALLVGMGTASFAQMISPVDFMRNNPRSNNANPAFFIKDYGYFDLGLGGLNIGVENIGLKYDNFFRFNSAGQPTVLDLNQGLASLGDENYIGTYFNFDIFSCGRRTKHGYFTYVHRIREVQSLSFNKDLVQLLANGNAAFLGEENPADINLGLAARAFQEFDLGYQMALEEHLNIGFRLKFLMGFMDAKTNNFNVKLYTDPTTYALKIMSAADIQATLPYQFVMENGELQIVDKRFNPANLFKNYGFGVDLGAEYIINEHFGVAAAVNDLGRITWNNYSINLLSQIQDAGSYYDNGAFVFTGLTSDQVNSIMNDPDFASNLLDSLSGYLDVNFQNATKYTTGLNANFMVRGYFDANASNRFSAQFTGYNLGLGIKPAVTLAYTGSFSDKYDLVATYTMMPGSYDNVGIGLSANFGGLLLYVASNNVLGFFNPANSSHLNAQFGISLTSGEFVSREEAIIIRDKAASNYDEDDDDDW